MELLITCFSSSEFFARLLALSNQGPRRNPSWEAKSTSISLTMLRNKSLYVLAFLKSFSLYASITLRKTWFAYLARAFLVRSMRSYLQQHHDPMHINFIGHLNSSFYLYDNIGNILLTNNKLCIISISTLFYVKKNTKLTWKCYCLKVHLCMIRKALMRIWHQKLNTTDEVYHMYHHPL